MIAAGLLARKAVEGRAGMPALGEDLPGAGFARRHPVPRQGRPHALPRKAGFQPGGLRMHDLHRQLRPLAGRDRRCRHSRKDLAVVAVLSGNRNFEGRIHGQVKASYLASPPLCVAYALAGTVHVRPDCRIRSGAVATASRCTSRTSGRAQKKSNRWSPPRCRRISSTSSTAASSRATRSGRACRRPRAPCSHWDGESTYVREPPYFIEFASVPAPPSDIAGAGAGAVRRFDHDRSHLPGGLDHRRLPRRQVTCRRMPCRRMNSTALGPGAAITKS